MTAAEYLFREALLGRFSLYLEDVLFRRREFTDFPGYVQLGEIAGLRFTLHFLPTLPSPWKYKSQVEGQADSRRKGHCRLGLRLHRRTQQLEEYLLSRSRIRRSSNSPADCVSAECYGSIR